MLNAEDLEREVSQLSSDEFKKFSEWFDEFKADQWDKQIEEDILAGRLDALAKHVDEEFLAGHATPL